MRHSYGTNCGDKGRQANRRLVAGFGDDRTTKAINHLIKLYESWYAAEPGKGYAEKAAEWREKLPEETEPKNP